MCWCFHSLTLWLISMIDSSRKWGTLSLRGIANYDLNLIENEVMGYIEGSTIQPSKEDILAYIKYMKGDIRARGIII